MNEETPDKPYEFAARLTLLETLVADLLLNVMAGDPDPLGTVQRVKAQTIDKLRYRMTIPADATRTDADMLLRVQARTIAFAEQWFADLEETLGRRHSG